MEIYRNKRKFLHKEGLTPTELVSLGMINMTAVAFWGTNTADVTLCENAP